MKGKEIDSYIIDDYQPKEESGWWQVAAIILLLLIGGLIGGLAGNIYWEQRMKNAMGGLETIEEIINCPVEFATDRKTGKAYVIYRFGKGTEILPLDKPLK